MKRGFLRLVMTLAALLAMAQIAVAVVLLVAADGAIGPAVQLLFNAAVCVVSAWVCSAVLADDREARIFAATYEAVTD